MKRIGIVLVLAAMVGCGRVLNRLDAVSGCALR